MKQSGGDVLVRGTKGWRAHFLEHVRRLARDEGHARLTSQIYAEAAVSPALAQVVRRQLDRLRSAVVELIPDGRDDEAEGIAEAFVALSSGYAQQLAVRGDLDPAPFARALIAIVER